MKTQEHPRRWFWFCFVVLKNPVKPETWNVYQSRSVIGCRLPCWLTSGQSYMSIDHCLSYRDGPLFYLIKIRHRPVSGSSLGRYFARMCEYTRLMSLNHHCLWGTVWTCFWHYLYPTPICLHPSDFTHVTLIYFEHFPYLIWSTFWYYSRWSISMFSSCPFCGLSCAFFFFS